MEKLTIKNKQPKFEIEAELNAVPTLLSVLVRKFSRDLKFEKKDLEKVKELQSKGILVGVNLVVSTGFKENKRLINGELEDYRHANNNCLHLVLESPKDDKPTTVIHPSKEKAKESEFVVKEPTKKKVTRKKTTKKVTKKAA